MKSDERSNMTTIATSVIRYRNGTLDRLTDSEPGLAPYPQGQELYIDRAAQMRGHGKANVIQTRFVTPAEAQRLRDEWDAGEPIRLSDAW
jgi:hypothetical protein